MYRIIIVDDEPLILAGIASLIRWEEHDCTIVGKATNGLAALELIRKLKPDILITDIRMPVMDGLKLVETCREENLRFSFLVLTNVEEFDLARKALGLGASGYLVKLSLNEEELLEALERAKEDSDRQRPRSAARAETGKEGLSDPFADYLNQRFVQKNGQAPATEEIKARCRDMIFAQFLVRHDSMDSLSEEEEENIRHVRPQIMEILNTLSSRFFQDVCILPAGQGLFCMAAWLKNGDFDPDDTKMTDACRDVIRAFADKANVALKTYFELTAVFGVSTVCPSFADLETCYEQAGTALDYYYYDSSAPVVFFEGQKLPQSSGRSFNINFMKKDLAACVHQNDSASLRSMFDQMLGLFRENLPSKSVAVSACINLYTYLYSFFEQESEACLDIFPYSINVARHLSQFYSLAEILDWMQDFGDKLCRLLDDRKKNPADRLSARTRQYISEHCQEKLTLAKIAQDLNISAGHLSLTFSKSMGMTVSDYIALVKTEKAKELLGTHQYLIYEISDMLGFESPYYFSKVFKKVTGLSPREYEKSV